MYNLESFKYFIFPCSLMSADKTKVSCWVPNDILEKLDSLYPNNRADAIRDGIQLLIEDSEMEDPEESKRFQVYSEGIQLARCNEMEKHIETLKMQLEQANRDKEALEKMFNNHVLQTQSLINKVGDNVLQIESVNKKVDYMTDNLEDVKKTLEDSGTKKKKWYWPFEN